MKKRHILSTIALSFALGASAQTNPTQLITFQPNTPAKAAEVNQNFLALQAQIANVAGALTTITGTLTPPMEINTVDYIPAYGTGNTVTVNYNRYQATGNSADTVGTELTGVKQIGTRTVVYTKTDNTNSVDIMRVVKEYDLSATPVLTFQVDQYFKRDKASGDLFLVRQDVYKKDSTGAVPTSPTASRYYNNLLIRPGKIFAGEAYADAKLATGNPAATPMYVFSSSKMAKTSRIITKIQAQPQFAQLTNPECFEELDFAKDKVRLFCKGIGVTERIGTDKSDNTITSMLVYTSIQ